METLTQENFWNKMKEDYPKAMEKFCIWIDKYKKDNNWSKFFNEGAFWFADNNKPTSITSSPKYHDLPVAMQFGIYIEFMSEAIRLQAVTVGNPRKTIEYHLKKLERDLNG